MLYRQLGRTGLNVSQLGFGAMRLPMVEKDDEKVIDREKAIPMIHRAFEGGVNYLDTAVFYCNGDSQRVCGEALKGWRDKIVVSTKNHYYGEDESEWQQNLQDSLERLDVDCIDIYNHHGINYKRYVEAVEPRVSKWMLKAKEQGLIKHICTSFHDDNDGLKKLVKTGYPDVITLQYNLIDRQLEEGIAMAAENGIGVVVMGPVGGGSLGMDTDVMGQLNPNIKRVPELAIRFVLANPNVSVALSGMSTMEQVEENLKICSDPTPLSEADKSAIEEQLEKLKKMADLYCTGCRYCMPCEAAKVDIAKIFRIYNKGRVYGLWDTARREYNNMIKHNPKWGVPADACIECGQCEGKCPQSIPIRKQLAEAHEALTAEG